MTTIRVAKRDRFTTVARATINDKALSFRARGLLFWLLDKPDDWSVDSEAISKEATEGRDAVRSALRELETAGYLRREKYRDRSGQFRTDVTVFETPNAAPMSGSVHNGNPVAGLTSGNDANEQVAPATGKPPLDTRRRILRPSYEDCEPNTDYPAVSREECEQCHGTDWYGPDTGDRHQAAVKCDHRIGALAGGHPIGAPS